MNDMELNSIITRVGHNSKLILCDFSKLTYIKEEICRKVAKIYGDR